MYTKLYQGECKDIWHAPPTHTSMVIRIWVLWFSVVKVVRPNFNIIHPTLLGVD